VVEQNLDYLVFVAKDTKGVSREILVDHVDGELFRSHTWHVTSKGYVATNVKRNGVNWYEGWATGKLHRMILKAPKGKVVDHINHNKLDNRRTNIRICTPQENARHCKKTTPTKSGLKGVYDNRHGKWAAAIRVDDKLLHLGTFSTKEDAARTYDAAARKYFGEFALANFPQEIG
jgi:hypothetical protein